MNAEELKKYYELITDVWKYLKHWLTTDEISVQKVIDSGHDLHKKHGETVLASELIADAQHEIQRVREL